MNNLSKNLKMLRKQNKLTQQDVAEYLNITRMAYNHWELGTREPDVDNLIKLSKYFKVSLDYLVGNYLNVFENNSTCPDIVAS
jgi:transcriptional regulator with XRE-family HTH domain